MRVTSGQFICFVFHPQNMSLTFNFNLLFTLVGGRELGVMPIKSSGIFSQHKMMLWINFAFVSKSTHQNQTILVHVICSSKFHWFACPVIIKRQIVMLLTKIFPMIVSCNDYFFLLPFLLNLSFLFSYFYNQMYRK